MPKAKATAAFFSIFSAASSSRRAASSFAAASASACAAASASACAAAAAAASASACAAAIFAAAAAFASASAAAAVAIANDTALASSCSFATLSRTNRPRTAACNFTLAAFRAAAAFRADMTRAAFWIKPAASAAAFASAASTAAFASASAAAVAIANAKDSASPPLPSGADKRAGLGIGVSCKSAFAIPRATAAESFFDSNFGGPSLLELFLFITIHFSNSLYSLSNSSSEIVNFFMFSLNDLSFLFVLFSLALLYI